MEECYNNLQSSKQDFTEVREKLEKYSEKFRNIEGIFRNISVQGLYKQKKILIKKAIVCVKQYHVKLKLASLLDPV